MRRAVLVLSLLGLTTAGAGILASGAAATRAPAPTPKVVRMPARVTIGGVPVGGMSREGALAAVRRSVERPLAVRVGPTRFRLDPERLGMIAYVKTAVGRAVHSEAGTAVPLGIIVHAKPVRAFFARLSERFDRRPVDSVLLLRNLAPYVTKGRPGRKLAEGPAVAAVVQTLAANRRTPVVLKLTPIAQRLSRTTFGPVIVIRRESRQLYLYDGMRLDRQFAVAVGQEAYPTPLGRFAIAVKWRDPWWYPPQSPWAKGLKPVPPGPGNPLGTRWMGLSSPGVGIHGTPDDASIGYSLSHGCIRMHISDAEWLFDHVEVGATVFIVPA